MSLNSQSWIPFSHQMPSKFQTVICSVSLSLWATITKCHRLGSISTKGIYFLQFWSLESPGSGYQQIFSLVIARFLAHRGPSFLHLCMAGGARALSGVSFIRALIPFLRVLPSWPDFILKGPSSKYHNIGGIGLDQRIWDGGNTNIKSIAHDVVV